MIGTHSYKRFYSFILSRLILCITDSKPLGLLIQGEEYFDGCEAYHILPILNSHWIFPGRQAFT